MVHTHGTIREPNRSQGEIAGKRWHTLHAQLHGRDQLIARLCTRIEADITAHAQAGAAHAAQERKIVELTLDVEGLADAVIKKDAYIHYLTAFIERKDDDLARLNVAMHEMTRQRDQLMATLAERDAQPIVLREDHYRTIVDESDTRRSCGDMAEGPAAPAGNGNSSD